MYSVQFFSLSQEHHDYFDPLFYSSNILFQDILHRNIGNNLAASLSPPDSRCEVLVRQPAGGDAARPLRPHPAADTVCLLGLPLLDGD